MSQINITVQKPVWPAQCACCNADNETTILIEVVDGDEEEGRVLNPKDWAVPYCSHCTEHVQSALSITGKTFLGPIPSLGALFSLVLSLILCAVLESIWPLVGIVVLIQSLIAFYRWKGIERAKTMMKPHCCGHGPAVSCVGHREAKGNIYTFNFKNKEYAQLFKSLNQER